MTPNDFFFFHLKPRVAFPSTSCGAKLVYHGYKEMNKNKQTKMTQGFTLLSFLDVIFTVWWVFFPHLGNAFPDLTGCHPLSSVSSETVFVFCLQRSRAGIGLNLSWRAHFEYYSTEKDPPGVCTEKQMNIQLWYYLKQYYVIYFAKDVFHRIMSHVSVLQTANVILCCSPQSSFYCHDCRHPTGWVRASPWGQKRRERAPSPLAHSYVNIESGS